MTGTVRVKDRLDCIQYNLAREFSTLLHMTCYFVTCGQQLASNLAGNRILVRCQVVHHFIHCHKISRHDLPNLYYFKLSHKVILFIMNVWTNMSELQTHFTAFMALYEAIISCWVHIIFRVILKKHRHSQPMKVYTVYVITATSSGNFPCVYSHQRLSKTPMFELRRLSATYTT